MPNSFPTEQAVATKPPLDQTKFVVAPSHNFENDHFLNRTKVVDKDDKPKVVYHGTPEAGFTEIDPNKLNEKSLFGKGIYATENPAIASEYSDKLGSGGAAVYPFYFSIKNPLRADVPLKREDALILGDTFEKLWHPDRPFFLNTDTVTEGLLKYVEKKYMLEDILVLLNEVMKNNGHFFNCKDFNKLFRTAGYDGIFYIGGSRVARDDGTVTPPHNVWVAFNPDQVRSIYDKRFQK